MGYAEAIGLAFKILAPLVEALVKYLMKETDERPAFLLTLPDTLVSEIELARKLGEISKD